MYGYIYKTTNLLNGRKYIGQSRGKFKAWYLGSGILLKKAINKYGKENFSVNLIKAAKTKTELNELEVLYIKEHNCISSKIYYNLHEGGRGGDTFSGKKHKASSRKKMSIKKKGMPSPHKGKTFRPTTEKEKYERMLVSPTRIEIFVNDKKYNSFNEASKDLKIRLGRPSIPFYRKRGYKIFIPSAPNF